MHVPLSLKVNCKITTSNYKHSNTYTGTMTLFSTTAEEARSGGWRTCVLVLNWFCLQIELCGCSCFPSEALLFHLFRIRSPGQSWCVLQILPVWYSEDTHTHTQIQQIYCWEYIKSEETHKHSTHMHLVSRGSFLKLEKWILMMSSSNERGYWALKRKL